MNLAARGPITPTEQFGAAQPVQNAAPEVQVEAASLALPVLIIFMVVIIGMALWAFISLRTRNRL